MMKWFRMMCLLVLLLMFPVVFPIGTYADVVIGNEFFYNNKNSTESIGERYYGKLFIINSQEGYIIPKEEPGLLYGISTDHGYRSGWGHENFPKQEGDVYSFPNGWIIVIEAVYLHNEKYWGIMSPSHMYQPPGWVLMDDLLVMYDCQDFEIENKDSFYLYDGSYDAILSAERLVLWQWPGSDQEKKITYDRTTISGCAKFLYVYQDKDGREWGKAEYTEQWICISDPENSKIPSFYPAPNPTKWLPNNNHDWSSTDTAIYPQQNPPKHLLKERFAISIPMLVLLCTLVLGVVIAWVCKPKAEE